jgi:hypothetical protein
VRFGLELPHQQRQIRFTVSAPASSRFDTWFKFTCTAVDDATGAIRTDYAGIAVFTTNGGGGSITGSAYLTNGTGQFDCYFHDAGTWYIYATDSVDTSIKGNSAGTYTDVVIPGSIAFTSTQWWTIPVGFNPNNNYADIYGGGGGGGGGHGSPVTDGGGGGGGGFARCYNMALTPGMSLLIYVGAGGAHGAVMDVNQNPGGPGGAGGYSGVMNSAQTAWFGLAYGGGGGAGGSNSSNGGGGGGSGAIGYGPQLYTGGSGETGYAPGSVQNPGGDNGSMGGGCAGPSGGGGTPGAGGGYAGAGGAAFNQGGGLYGGGGAGGGGTWQADPTDGGQGIVFIAWGA